MIRINLLTEKRAPGKPKVAAPAGEGFQPIFLVYMLIVLGALGFVGFRWYLLNSEKTRLEAEQREKEKERQRLAEIIQRAEKFNRDKELLERKIKVIEDLKLRQKVPKIMLEQLETNLPEYVWFRMVNESGFNLSIDGFALNANKLADYMTNLEDSGFFKEVFTPEYHEENGIIVFKLTCKFQMPT